MELLFGDKDSVSAEDMNAFAESRANGDKLLAAILQEGNRRGLLRVDEKGNVIRTEARGAEKRPAGYYGGENDTTDARTVRFLGNLAKAANIRIERATIGENENGYYIKGKAVLAEDAGIEVAKHEITHADEKRTIPLLQTMGLQSRPIELQRYGSMGSIRYIGQNVKIDGVPFEKLACSVTIDVRPRV